MKYALVDNVRCEAEKGLKGKCPVCFQPVIARCGNFKINHWAHRFVADCDKWWERETEWHRKWKDMFSNEIQEKVLCDEITGEKHIADIYSNNEIVIEFQHSSISSQERESREKFYKKMFWVVDGTRRERDYPRFLKAIKERKILPTGKVGYFYINYLDECFPQDWISSSVPVVFDFKGLLEDKEQDPYRETLWCLLPKDKTRNQYKSDGYLVTTTVRDLLVGMQKDDFVENHINYFKYFTS